MYLKPKEFLKKDFLRKVLTSRRQIKESTVQSADATNIEHSDVTVWFVMHVPSERRIKMSTTDRL